MLWVSRQEWCGGVEQVSMVSAVHLFCFKTCKKFLKIFLDAATFPLQMPNFSLGLDLVSLQDRQALQIVISCFKCDCEKAQQV